MGSLSDFLEAKVLDHLFGATSYTPPGTWYVALLSVAPSDSGGGTEISGNGYARVAVANNTTNFPNATGTSPTQKTNGTAITFPIATGDWAGGANVVAFALFDASSGGNMGPWSTLTQAKPVLSGDTISFAASTLVFTLD